MRVSAAVLVVYAMICLSSHSALALTMTLNNYDDSYVEVFAAHADGLGFFDYLDPTTLPMVDDLLVIHVDAESASNYDFSKDELRVTFQHNRSENSGSLAQALGYIYFSVDEDVTYTASGSYSTASKGPGSIYFGASLYDYTDGLYLFNSIQESSLVGVESFTLGLSEGNGNGTNVGSLGGALIAGHDYEFYFNAEISVPTDGIYSAAGAGNVTVSFVPEPRAAILLGAGLLMLYGLATHRHRGDQG